MNIKQARDLGIPVSALNPPMPDGWRKIAKGNVRSGDKVHLPEGWAEASEVSEVGTGAQFYTCVIRRITKETK